MKTNPKIIFTEEEKSNSEEFYWKLLHYKLFGELSATYPKFLRILINEVVVKAVKLFRSKSFISIIFNYFFYLTNVLV